MTSEDVRAPDPAAGLAAGTEAAGSVQDAEAQLPQGLVARLKGHRERLTTRALEERDKLSERRSASEAIDTAFSMFERDSLAGGPVLAGAVAFRVFLFVVPYVFVLVAGFGLASDAAGDSPSDAARQAGISGLIAQSIGDVADLSWFSRISAFIVGGFALFLAARSAVKVLQITHFLVWDLEMRRPKKLTRAAAVLIGLVTVAVALAWVVGRFRERSFIGGITGLVLYVLVPTAVWLAVSWFLPHAKCPWWALVPGAVLFGVGVELLHVFTVVWIAHSIETKSDAYGALGTALALLLWAYVLGRIIVASATLNAARWKAYLARHPEWAPATTD